MDVSNEAKMLLSAVQQTNNMFGLGMPVDVLRGSKNKKLIERGFHQKCSVYGAGAKTYSEKWWKELGYTLIKV